MQSFADAAVPTYVGAGEVSADMWTFTPEDGLKGYPYVRLCCESGECDIEDSVFYRITRPVIFQVSKWELAQHDTFLEELDETVFPHIIAKGWRLCKIEIRGAASPEGPWSWNQTLGTNRAAVLQKKILSMLPEFAHPKSSDVVVNHLVEDYPYLVYMLKEAGDPAYELVKQIVEEHQGDDIATKQALQRVTGEHAGLWARMKATYFPRLRAARVLLWMEPISNQDLLRASAERDAYMAAHPVVEKPVQPQTPEAPETPEPPETPETLDDCCGQDADSASIQGEPCGEALDGYPFVRKCTSPKCFEMSDSMFYSITMPVVFEINKWDIRKDDQFVKTFEKEIIPKTVEKGWRICRIELRGAASPEGPTRWNEILAQRRSQALQSKLLGMLPDFAQPKESQLVVVEHTEDYAGLVYMMKQANDPDYELVRSIVEEPGITDAEIKQRLQSNSVLWRRMLRTYFPGLRAGRLVIWMEPFTEEEMASTEEVRREFLSGKKILPLPAPLKRMETAPLTIPQPLKFPYLPADKYPGHRVVSRKDTVAKDTIVPVQPDTLAKDTIVPVQPDTLAQDTIAPLQPDTLRRDTVNWGATVRLNRKEVLSIKTNLLLDAAYVHTYGFVPILNAQVEYYPKHGHITPVLSFDGPWWTYERAQHKYFQVRNYQIEGRYYFRREDARYDGFYAGVYGHGMLYSVGFNADKGYYGEGWGAGVSGGYVLPLIKGYKHIKLEFGLQVGYFQTRYDPFVYGCPVEDVDDGKYYYNYVGRPENFRERLWRWQWFGPTRVGITFTYDLLYRKIQNKGISFKWYETLQEAQPVK